VPSLVLVLVLAAVAATGCATSAGPVGHNAPLHLTELSAPAPSASTEWSELPLAAAVVPAASALPRAPRVGGPWISHIALLGGGRWMDEDDWGTLDKQLVAGVQVDEYKSDSGHGYEVGVLYAHDEDELEFTSYELFGGYRHTFGAEGDELHPFLSAGASVTRGELEVSGPSVDDSDDDVVLGAYLRAGLLWDVSERVRLGVDYRRLFAEDFEFDLAGSSSDPAANSDQVVLSFGYEF